MTEQGPTESPAAREPARGPLRPQRAGRVRLAYFLTGNRELAEDLVQEAFVRVAGPVPAPPRCPTFDAYLRRTIVNLFTSHLRRTKLERAYLTRHGAELADRARSERPCRRATSSGERSTRCQTPARRDRPPLLRRPFRTQSAEGLHRSPGALNQLVVRGHVRPPRTDRRRRTMNDLNDDLAEMFHRREGDVPSSAFAPTHLVARTRRRERLTVGVGIAAAVDRGRRARSPVSARSAHPMGRSRETSNPRTASISGERAGRPPRLAPRHPHPSAVRRVGTWRGGARRARTPRGVRRRAALTRADAGRSAAGGGNTQPPADRSVRRR